MNIKVDNNLITPNEDDQSLLDLTKFYQSKFKKFVTLDFETTGFTHGVDEVISCSVKNQDGIVLIDTLVKPIYKTSWDEAQKVNGLSPEQVFTNGIEYNDLIILLYPIFSEYKNVIIYNAEFDTGFLPRDLLSLADIYCAMRLYVEFSQCHNKYESYDRFQKQYRAADQLGIDYQDLDLHVASSDAELCRRIWIKIISLSNAMIRDFIQPFPIKTTNVI